MRSFDSDHAVWLRRMSHRQSHFTFNVVTSLFPAICITYAVKEIKIVACLCHKNVHIEKFACLKVASSNRREQH